MNRVKHKLSSQSGASLALALLLFLVCACVGVAVLTASASNAGKMSHVRQDQQSYLSVSSAARAIREDVGKARFTASYRRVETTVTTWTMEKDEETEEEIWTSAVAPTQITYRTDLAEDQPLVTDSVLADLLRRDCAALFREAADLRESRPVFAGTAAPPESHVLVLAPDGADQRTAEALGTVNLGLTVGEDHALSVRLNQPDGEGGALDPMTFTMTAQPVWTEETGTRVDTSSGAGWETKTVTVTTTCTLTVTWDASAPILRDQTSRGGETT